MMDDVYAYYHRKLTPSEAEAYKKYLDGYYRDQNNKRESVCNEQKRHENKKEKL